MTCASATRPGGPLPAGFRSGLADQPDRLGNAVRLGVFRLWRMTRARVTPRAGASAGAASPSPQLLPYIGYDRTLNALNCLNEIIPEPYAATGKPRWRPSQAL